MSYLTFQMFGLNLCQLSADFMIKKQIRQTQFYQVQKEELLKVVNELGFEKPKPCTYKSLADIIKNHVYDNCDEYCLIFY